MKRREHVYTFVELCILIAIVSIMVNLVLPVVRNFRERTRTFSCINQMKQLGEIITSYTTDFGVFPYQCYDHSPNFQATYTWTMWTPYFKENRNLLNCPSEDVMPEDDWAPWAAPHYNFNGNGKGNPNDRDNHLSNLKTSSVTHPASIVVSADAVPRQWKSDTRYGDPQSPFIDIWGYPLQAPGHDGRIAMRHGSGRSKYGRSQANFLYMDNHVVKLSRSEINNSIFNAGF